MSERENRKEGKESKTSTVSLAQRPQWVSLTGHSTLASSLTAFHHMDLGWSGSKLRPPQSVRPPLIRTIMPSSSRGPVTQNGVTPSPKLVSLSPDYERRREQYTASVDKHRQADSAITLGVRWLSWEGWWWGGEDNWEKMRDRGKQGVKPGSAWEVTVAMELTWVTSGLIGCDAVQRFAAGQGHWLYSVT